MQSFAKHSQPTSAPSRRRAILLGASLVIAGLALSKPAAAQLIPPVSNVGATFTDLQNIPGITGITTTNCSGADDCLTTAITLPFTFSYLGQNKTALKVSSNCWMTFDTSYTSSNLSNTTIPNTNAPNDLIAFAWDDCRSSTMRYGVFGSTGNRVFVIESIYRYWSGGSTSNDAKNQIWLYEADGSFEMRYAGTSHVNSHSASIGFENSSGTAGYAESCTPRCSASNLGALDGRMLRAGAFEDPEFTIEVGDFPRGGFPGTTGTGTISIDNLSTETATGVVVEAWLSVDDTLDPAVDYLIGTATIANAPQNTTTTAVNYTVPTALPPGDYNVIGRVDPANRFPELVETDNVDVAAQRFATAYELSGGGCRVTNPRGVNPGETLNFEVDLVNNGVPYVGPLSIELRASTDSSFDSGDPILDTVSVAFTGANLETGSGSFTLASGALTPGRYFPICIIDPANSVTETVETNNIVVGATQFGSGPDLTISAITMPRQVQPGSAVNVSTTITNIAVPFTGAVQYRLYLSRDDVLDTTSDINLGLFNAAFAGEDDITDVESITFATSLPGGRYRIIGVVDPRTRIPEVDEMNNEGVSATEIVNAIDFVGLTASTNVTTVQANDMMSVSGSAESTGLSFVGNVPVGVFFSSDQTFDATDFEAYRGLIFFPGNTTGSIDVTFAVPSVPPGSYSILVVVNPDNNPVEADRDNNAARASGLVTVQGADLRADTLIAPDVAFIGRNMEVSLTVQNESTVADARGFRYAYYLSENDLIRVTDRQVLVSDSATIAAGGSQTYVDQIPIPTSFTSTQSLFLGVIVDIFSAVPETNENNNIRRKPTPISIVFPIPDLEGQIVQTATSAAAGEQLAVTRLLTNSGVADSGNFDFTYYLSNNPTISTDDIAIGTFSASLETNSDDFGIDVVNIPPDVIPGSYFLGLILDPADTVLEVSNDNNAVLGPNLPVFGAAIVFITDRVADGTIGVLYQTGIYARGGPLPITWSVSDGSLPPGIELDSTGGILSGTPTTEGLYEFTLRASSGTAFADRAFSIRITSPTVQLRIATQTLRSAIASRAYSADVIAVGGVPPYKWSVITGLPTGMSFSEAGRLEGTPTTPGQFDITFRVEDDLGAQATAQIPLNIVSPGQSIQIDQVPLSPPIVGLPYCSDDSKVSFTARNGVPPYTWSVMGALPPGMTFNEMGELCGTPERAGDYDLTVRAQDTTGLFDTALFRITVRGNGTCAIATFTLPPAQINEPYVDASGSAVRLIQAKCVEPLSDWMLVEGGGALPAGLTLGTDGTISGTPTEEGNFAFIAMISDASLSSAVQPLSITVQGLPPVIEDPDDGCTCATPQAPDAPLAWLALLPGVALMLRRRRR